ncbi:hypothetical protein MACJ_000203 [Theileria orientalis]|uniref:Small-subunit processome Utp21 domain-containing protein n=1 Tax=Theileria orientalis TaxID=68886 RepID=A0A976M3N3_THEOR|nr:hypothetical protein MACJ_000203 [Theileria orientalis]
MLNASESTGRRSSIFNPCGQLGLICDGKAFCLNNLGKTSFITVSTLNQFIVYDSLGLKVCFISLPLKSNVKSIAAKYENVFLVLNDESIHSFHKYDHREIHHEHKSDIISIFFHDDILVTYSSSELITYAKEEVNDGNSSSKWNLERVIPLGPSEIKKVLPLIGFSNKALVGFSDSKLILLNLKSSKLVHTFEFKVENSKFDSTRIAEGISVMSQSCNGSSGVVAVGYRCGYVGVVDINKDQLLGGFKLSGKQGEPTSMRFVYDKLNTASKSSHLSAVVELIVAGTSSGDLIVFDLNSFTIISCIESAHMSPVNEIMYIETHNNLVSLGDNAMIVWNMDSEKSFLRLLKSRIGLVGKINMIRAYDTEQHDILVSSSLNDHGHLGKISTIQQQQSTSFSTKASKAPLKLITGMSCSYQRHYDWPNIITCHSNTHDVHVWSGFRGALIDKVLRVDGVKSTATAVCMTRCGNYAIVGYANGQIHVFTLQNCNHDSELLRTVDGKASQAHRSRVIDISLVGNSKFVSVSDSKQDRSVRVWDVMKLKMEFEYDPDLPQGCSAYMAASGNFLTALACTNNNIYILDVFGKMIVRQISYHVEATSMSFHINDNWFIASFVDSTMVVYDILSDCYVDYVKFSGTILDLNMDRTSSFLLVSNERAPGMIIQYSNRHSFELFPKTILYRDIPSNPVQIDVSSESSLEHDTTQDAIKHEFESQKTQIEEGMITLSGLSSNELHTILFLDEIKRISRPMEPIKSKDDTPFFIPTTYKDGQLVFVEPERENIEHEAPKPSILNSSSATTEFEDIINSGRDESEKYKDMLNYLLNQSASGVHLSLSLLSESKMDENLDKLIGFFLYHIEQKTNADALQVFLHIFLRFHAERISKLQNIKTKEKIKCLISHLKGDYTTLQSSFDRISCYIKLLTHLQTD